MKSAAEKAKELVNRYWEVMPSLQTAKQASVICVDEILAELHFSSNNGERKDFFESVKQEIELL